MGAVERRTLAWDGCFNVRDLGGLETASGGRTRGGAVVRADNVRGLTAVGWQAALDHGVRRLVDLRFENEVPGELGPPEAIEVIAVSLLGQHDPVEAHAHQERMRATDDVAPVFAAEYVSILQNGAGRVAAAVTAVAEADPDHCVVVHCFAGKDRTGIVSALLLSLVGVSDEIVAEDYAASHPGVVALSAGWFATAADEAELELRRRFCSSPYAAMAEVLNWLRETAGGAEGYLRSAGLSPSHLSRLRSRLVDA